MGPAEDRLASRRQTYALIHKLQPAALIIPNNHELPRPGEDVQTFERDQPGANGQGFNTTEIGALPLEMSETMNDSWGFRLTDRNWKSPVRLIRTMVEAAGRNTNFLLNVGPRPDGTIPDSSVSRLAAIGAWMRCERRVDPRHAWRATDPAAVGRDDAEG